MESHSSATPLARLRLVPADQAAWAQFTDRHGRKIYGWCRQWNLGDADAEDVTQNVLLKLAEKMRMFDDDSSRSFRGWLKTVTRHAWAGVGRDGGIRLFVPILALVRKVVAISSAARSTSPSSLTRWVGS